MCVGEVRPGSCLVISQFPLSVKPLVGGHEWLSLHLPAWVGGILWSVCVRIHLSWCPTVCRLYIKLLWLWVGVYNRIWSHWYQILYWRQLNKNLFLYTVLSILANRISLRRISHLSVTFEDLIEVFDVLFNSSLLLYIVAEALFLTFLTFLTWLMKCSTNAKHHLQRQ